MQIYKSKLEGKTMAVFQNLAAAVDFIKEFFNMIMSFFSSLFAGEDATV